MGERIESWLSRTKNKRGIMAVNTSIRDFIARNLENGNSEASRHYCSDPTTFGFNLWFDYGEESPLLNPPGGKGESAERYLRSIGEASRADSLVKFRNSLKELTTKFPYYLQTINGLGEMYKFDSKNALDERVLEIITLESVDLRIAGMVDTYMKVYWDIDYRRCMLPYNLQQVTFTVLVSEIRNLRTFVNKTACNNSTDEFKNLGEILGCFSFQFHKSRFDFSGSNPFLDSVNNSVPEVATNKFKMECGKLHDGTRIDIFDLFGQPSKSHAADQRTSARDSRIAQANAPGIVLGQDGGNDLGGDPSLRSNKIATQNTQKKETNNRLIELAKKKFKEEAEKMANQLEAGVRQTVLDRLKSLLAGAEFGNILFRGEDPNAFSLITGQQTLNSINPLKGRVGDWVAKIVNEQWKAGHISNRSTAEEEKAFRLKKIFEENIPGYNLNPKEAMTNSLILTNLGNVLSR